MGSPKEIVEERALAGAVPCGTPWRASGRGGAFFDFRRPPRKVVRTVPKNRAYPPRGSPLFTLRDGSSPLPRRDAAPRSRKVARPAPRQPPRPGPSSPFAGVPSPRPPVRVPRALAGPQAKDEHHQSPAQGRARASRESEPSPEQAAGKGDAEGAFVRDGPRSAFPRWVTFLGPAAPEAVASGARRAPSVSPRAGGASSQGCGVSARKVFGPCTTIQRATTTESAQTGAFPPQPSPPRYQKRHLESARGRRPAASGAARPEAGAGAPLFPAPRRTRNRAPMARPSCVTPTRTSLPSVAPDSSPRACGNFANCCSSGGFRGV